MNFPTWFLTRRSFLPKIVSTLFILVNVSVVLWTVTDPQTAGAQTKPESTEAYDPWETFNRGSFWFNERIDHNILAPIADGYDYVTTDTMQTGVTNFFNNLKFPTLLAADILQAKFGQALTHTGRFLVNSTVGVLGFIDVASDIGLVHKEEDFALVFDSWGIPEGPYLVVPFLGPSTVRNTFGTVFDFLTSPSYLITQTNASDDLQFWWPIGSNALNIVNLRNNYDDAIEAGRHGSLDYYMFQQSSYLQYRHGLERGESSARYGEPGANDSVGDDLDAILKNEK